MSNGVGSNENDPFYLDWRELPWHQRLVKIGAWIMAVAVALIIWLGAILFLHDLEHGISRHNSEHRRCLQQATNGLAIKECH